MTAATPVQYCEGMKNALLTDAALKTLSIMADKAGDDRVFALCSRAFFGDLRARRALTDAVAARRAAKAVR